MDDNSLNNIAKSLQNFVKTTVKLGAIMNDISRNVIPAVQSFSAAAEQIGEDIQNAIPFDKLQKLADLLSSIPSDIQETRLYADALGLSRLDLHYEDIAYWLDLFQMHSSRDVKKVLAGLTFPTNSVEEYVTRTICNSRIPKREKIPVLLAHIEPLFYKAIGKTKMSRTPVKVIAKDTVSKQHDMRMESFKIVITLALANVVFSNTDQYKEPIDHTMPFRNNILHNGLLEYSNQDIRKVYDVLTAIIAILILIIGDYQTGDLTKY